jgi:hypothetical protein
MFESTDVSNRPRWKLRLFLAALAVLIVLAAIWVLRIVEMPLRSFAGTPPALSAEQGALRSRLESDVKFMSQTIGERNLSKPGTLETSVQYLQDRLQGMGYKVTAQRYSVYGQDVNNLEVIVPGIGGDAETIVVGAHYDSAQGTAGANDNATGTAAVLELARQFHNIKSRKTIQFVFFVNEEPPFFKTETMGSLIYAQELRRRHVPVCAMIAVETIGFYSDRVGSQKYPPLVGLFYPRQGNFIGFVGDLDSRDLVRHAIREFREYSKFPSEGIAAPPDIPGVDWSDHWSFWQENYPAIMITDTAVFRYPYYHTSQDTVGQIDFDKMSRVVDGIGRVVGSLANE